jgi:hypothetical protein
MSLLYNGAFTIFGGFAPAILTWFSKRPGSSMLAPAWYVMLAAAVALGAIPLLGTPASDGTYVPASSGNACPARTARSADTLKCWSLEKAHSIPAPASVRRMTLAAIWAGIGPRRAPNTGATGAASPTPVSKNARSR